MELLICSFKGKTEYLNMSNDYLQNGMHVIW